MNVTYGMFRPVPSVNKNRVELGEVVVCENEVPRVERIVRRGGPWRWARDLSVCPAGVYAAQDTYRRAYGVQA